LFGGMGWVRNDNVAKVGYCAQFALTHPGLGLTYTCNPDFSLSMLGVVTRWTPVKNLTFSAEAIWTHLNTSMSGFSTFSPAAPQPIAAFTFKNQDTASFNVRVQRNF
jgi:hypothetical protein